MPRSRFRFFLFAVALPCAVFADGQPVHRCFGEHGEISFSGLPCSGATTPANATHDAEATHAAGINPSATMQTCPASAPALRDLVADAFARRSANAIAGVMRWDGVGGGAAHERMRDLVDMVGQPLLAIDIDGETNPADPASRDPLPATRALLTVRTGGAENGPHEHEFRVIPAGGCYWLDW